MLRVTRTPAAVRDLAAITDQTTDNLDAALRFYDELDCHLKLIARYPRMGEAVDHLSVGMRRQSLGNHVLFYRCRDNEIELVRVLHGARQMEDLF